MIKEKKWFINENNEIRWVCQFVSKNIEYDYSTTHIVVSMANNLNSPYLKGCLLEEVNTKDFFETKKECQFEIIRRERFDK